VADTSTAKALDICIVWRSISLTRLLLNGWWDLIVSVDEDVLALIMNSWRLIVNVDEEGLVLISLPVTVALFFLCDMLRG
jgi:hypothetical protein